MHLFKPVDPKHVATNLTFMHSNPVMMDNECPSSKSNIKSYANLSLFINFTEHCVLYMLTTS